MVRRALVLPFIVAALIFASGPAQAADPTAVEFAVGPYGGFFLSAVTRESGPFSFDLAAVRHRQLDGTLMVTGMSFPFTVTVAASHVFTAVGDGGSFVAHGMVMPNADGSSISMSDYRLGRDSGRLLFLHPVPTRNAAPLGGRYAGGFHRDDGQTGQLVIEVKQEGSSFEGAASFIVGSDQPAMTLPYLATVGEFDANGMAPIHVISLTPFAELTAHARLMRDGTIHGTVQVTFGDGSVHTAMFDLTAPTVIG